MSLFNPFYTFFPDHSLNTDDLSLKTAADKKYKISLQEKIRRFCKKRGRRVQEKELEMAVFRLNEFLFSCSVCALHLE